MAPQITAADRDRIIKTLAAAGKPAPDWVKKDPRLLHVFDQAGAAAHDPTRAAAAGKTPAAGTQPAAGKAPAGKRASRPAPTKQRNTSSAKRAAAPAGPVPLPRILTRAAGGSSAGGLVLAIFLYPIALALFQNGPAGLGMWLRAKFLNIGSTPNGTGAAAGFSETASQTAGGNTVPASSTPPAPWDPSFSEQAKGRGQPASKLPPLPPPPTQKGMTPQ